MLHQAPLIALLVVAAAAPSLQPVAPAAYQQTVVAPRKGKVVVASFWASYCVSCLEEMPMLVALDRARTDVDLVLVSTDPKEWKPKAQAALAKLKITGVPSYWADSEDPQPFIDAVDPAWAGEMPYTVVYAKDGKKAATISGQATKAQVEAAIEKALRP